MSGAARSDRSPSAGHGAHDEAIVSTHRRIRGNPCPHLSALPDVGPLARREREVDRKEADVATFWTIVVLTFTGGVLALGGFALVRMLTAGHRHLAH